MGLVNFPVSKRFEFRRQKKFFTGLGISFLCSDPKLRAMAEISAKDVLAELGE